MDKNLIAQATTTINAPASRVWEALTDPAQIKEYMFGTDVVTDWQVGSPIVWQGEWKGKPYQDKGKIVEIEPEKLLHVTHYSPLSGVPDAPENYHNVRYTLSPENGGTRVNINQDKNASEQEQKESAGMWQTALDGIKKFIETK
jgi:uncharacterized protein YndB with AHSA1/START domain